MAITPRLMTADELLLLPDDGRLQEQPGGNCGQCHRRAGNMATTRVSSMAPWERMSVRIVWGGW